MMVRVATLGLLFTAALLAQTPATPAEPGLGDTEQPRPTAPADIPLPTTYTFPEKSVNPHLDPSIAPPPLPKSRVALIGGTVGEIDAIRSRMKVDLFGGGKMNVIFDGRTKVSSNGNDFSPMKIKKGDRVYLDTQNVQGKLFARQIQVNNTTFPTEIRGQVTDFYPQTGELYLHDALSASAVKIVVSNTTVIRGRTGAGQMSQLQPGAYIMARFDPARGAKNLGKEIQIIVAPGESFRFLGTVRNLDLRSGYLSVENKVDDTLYELRAGVEELRDKNVTIGADVDLRAEFDGKDYVVRDMRVTQPAATPATEEQQPK
jgi:hypothetical protein